MLTMRAHQPPSFQHDIDGHNTDTEDDIDDIHPIETQKTIECSSDAHGRWTSQESGLETPKPWPQPVRVTRTPKTSLKRHPHNDPAKTPPTPGSGEPKRGVLMQSRTHPTTPI